jgi:hypothetical protein
MTEFKTQRTWALSLAQALQGTADELADMITTREDFCFDQDTSDLLQLLQSGTSTALGSNIVALLGVTNQILQHSAMVQGDLDRSQQSLATLQRQLELHERIAQLQSQSQPEKSFARRLSTNPDKFTGTETNIRKRHQSCITFEDKVISCIDQDRHFFDTEFKRIHFIGSLLVDDAYEAVRDGLRTVKSNVDPANWTWPTHLDLLKHLNNLYATTDLSWDAKMQLDKLTMGTSPFPNFLSNFNRLADRCKRQSMQKVELLKSKVSRDLLQNAILKGIEPEDDDFDAWCKLFQKTWKGMETIQHINSLTEHGKKGAASQQPFAKAPQASPTATPHPDAMDLSAIRQGAQNQNAMRPPPGADPRRWCADNNLCFYCKLPGHRLSDCEAKRAADRKRAQGLPLSTRQQFSNGYPRNSRNQLPGYQPNTFQQGSANNFSFDSGPMQNRAITGGFVEDGSIRSLTPTASAHGSSITPSQSISRALTPIDQGN